MQWNDEAIILSVKRLGEGSAVIHCLTREHGLHAGVDKGAFGKRKRGIYQPGNIVAAHWQARLSEHMGMINCELLEPIAAQILDSRHKLAALISAAQMTEKVLHERDRQPEVYVRMKALVEALRTGGDWLHAYVMLEFALLEHAGFGLDLASCASTGQQHDLIYVSPKSGRAVSREAGRPYHDRLFRLPGFLAMNSEDCHSREGMNPGQDPRLRGGDKGEEINITHILDGVRLCGHFLHERVFTPRGIAAPKARARFMEMIAEA